MFLRLFVYFALVAWMGKAFPDNRSKRAVHLAGCPHIVTRSEWEARAPTTPAEHLVAAAEYVTIHHTVTSRCRKKTDCIEIVQSIQKYHMTPKRNGDVFDDIAYSFLIGEDGNVYEGRGWDAVGEHTYGFNYVGLGFCIIGNFMDHVPNDAALTAVKEMIACGVANHKISSTYALQGHRDANRNANNGYTACPGNKLYDLIQSWPHYRYT